MVLEPHDCLDSVVLGLSIFLIVLSSLFHLFVKDSNASILASKGQAGGYVGYFLSSFLKSTISIYGALPLLVIALVVSILLIFDITLSKFLSLFKIKLPTFKMPFSIPLLNRDKFKDIGDVDVVDDILDKSFDYNSVEPSYSAQKTPVETTISGIPKSKTSEPTQRFISIHESTFGFVESDISYYVQPSIKQQSSWETVPD